MVGSPEPVVVPYGPAATRALVTTIRVAQGDDPLAPVTVVVPSAVAGVTLRRRLAGEGGLANVRFRPLDELARQIALPRLAAGGRRPLSRVRAEAVAASLLAGDGGMLAASAGEPSTARALAETFAELDDLDGRGLDRVGRVSRRAGDVVRTYRVFRARTASEASAHDVCAEAAAAVAAGVGLGELGQVVLHLPGRLRPAESALVDALTGRSQLRVIRGEADASLAELAAATTVVRALDPAEEVRIAVRHVVNGLAAGLSADRIAVVARVRHPYFLLVHEELEAAGIVHRVPAARTVTQTVAGRTLLGLLAIGRGGFRRAEVSGWLNGAPIVDPATGLRVPSAWWDRLARRAGIAGGIDQWRARLARALAVRAARPRPVDPDAPDAPPEPDRTAEGFEAVGAFIERLAADLEPPASGSWRDHARWARHLLDRYLDRRAVGAVEAEQRALEAVTGVLDELAALDGVAPPTDPARFAATVESHLDRPAAAGTLGHGVIVAGLADAVGADLDLVVLVGAAEGQLPPGRADDPLLPNRERRQAGMPGRGLTPDEEHTHFLAALAAAPQRVVTTPRADPRSQREQHPARWLLDLMSARLGRTVTGADLDALSASAEAPWFHDAVSFEWWLASGGEAATPHERDVAAMLAARRGGADIRQAAPARAQPVLARGLTAVMARRSGGLGEWSGLVGARPEFVSDLTAPQSPTSLETWVTCPFRYFLGSVLRVDEHEDPAEADSITALDRGSLVHEVLEAFIGEGLDRPPDHPWQPGERRRLHEVADEVAAAFESEGRTGRTLLWELDRLAIHRQLDRILDADDLHRSSRGVSPLAVEHGFGFPDTPHPALRVALDGEREVVFRGRIDRIDRSPDDDRLVVLDYKTGDPWSYANDRPGDLTGGGRRLQLLVYAAAARQAYARAGSDTPVEAHYWFVGDRGELQMRGGPVDATADARFRDVLGVVVDGVTGGLFPARPGAENYFRGFEHCRWCPYDRVCPTDRAEQWERARGHAALAGYRGLVEPAEEEAAR